VAWASSPRMDHQPSEWRHHSGQDAHCTMGRDGGVGFQPAHGPPAFGVATPPAFGVATPQRAGCPLHHEERWWRGLPARAWTTSLRSGGTAAGRMPTAPSAAAAASASASGSIGVRIAPRFEKGISPLASSLEMTWVEGRGTPTPAAPRSRVTVTVSVTASGRGVGHGPNRSRAARGSHGQLAALLRPCHLERACESRGPLLEALHVSRSEQSCR
jgi:hypothetical protein